jgi:hypothetical protein
VNDTQPGSSAGIEQRLELIARLLTAILTKDMGKKDAVLTLSGAGFAPKDVGDMLGLTRNQVSVILYDAKQAAAKAATTPKPKAASGGR